MAGFSRLYCIGGLGGFMGADGINPIELQIWIGDSDRQWLEARYFKEIKPIGNLKVIVPEWGCHPDSLLDACIAFYPQAFRECPSLTKVRKQLRDVEMLDFHMNKDEIPEDWFRLREEARLPFRKLNIFVADLIPVDHSPVDHNNVIPLRLMEY